MQPTDTDKSVGLTAQDLSEIRSRADADVFYFGTVICGHRDLVFEDHAPLMYATAGQNDRLLAVLRSDADSYTVEQFRKEAVRHRIDLDSDDAEGRLAEILRVVDLRVYRHSGKSSAMTHAVRTWKMTRDPNLSSALITNTDEKATDFCKQIRATILSDLYAAVYPDRVPADLKAMLTERRLTLAGRTVPDMEPSLMAFGVKSSPTGYHFDEFHFDDLVGRENKSVAELAVVREFLANLTGLYKPGIRYPVRRIHVGTRWDDDDDSALVRLYSQCFAVTVPIWVRGSASDDLTIPGVPTTRWYPLTKIQAEQEEVLSSPEEGPISWRCNYELDPAIAGGRIFHAALVDGADWIPRTGEDGKEWPARILTDPKTGETVMVKDGERMRPKALMFDPARLSIVTAVDQSFAEDGDEWAVATVGMDQYSHRYVLECTVGHNGVQGFLDAAEMHRLRWKPRRIGMERIAAQHVVELVLKLGAKYRYLRPLVEPVSHGNKPKEWRIRNGVAEVMKMRRLHLNPHEMHVKEEMKRYKPGKTAKDNILDALAMCEVLIHKSAEAQIGEEDYRVKFSRRNRTTQQRRDPSTGVQLW